MIEKIQKYQKHLYILFVGLVILTCVAVFYSFVTSPYTGDIEVFMAAANQAKYYPGNVLMRIFQAWELKGIFNRVVIFIVYWFTRLFVKYTDVVAFEACSKAIYGIGTIIALAISSYLLPVKSIKKKITYFVVAFLSIFATYTAVQMQAEMTVVVLAIFVFSCIASEKKPFVILGGILGALFFFSKSVFILIFFAVIAGVIIYKPSIKKKSILLACVSMIISEVIFVAAVKIIYPQEFVDMKNAAEFQSTLFSAGSNVSFISILTNFLHLFTQSCVAIPCLIISCICTIRLIYKYVARKEAGRIVAIIVCWLIPIDIIVASNTYFIYHYFLLMLPGIICVITYLAEEEINPLVCSTSIVLSSIAVAFCWLMKDGIMQWSFINYSTVLLVIIHLIVITFVFENVSSLNKYKIYASIIIVSAGCFFWMNYSSVFAPKHQNEIEMLKRSEEICKLSFPEDFSSEPVLYLDGGAVPFYVDAPSYSRYFFDLPLQRWSSGKEWEVQKSEYEKLMNYSGKYIVYTGWFGLDKYPDLQNKINSEYSVLSNSGIYTFSPDWNVFSLSIPPDIEQTNASSGAYILVRNDYIQSRNYLDVTMEETSLNGINVIPNGDGTYLVNGKATALTTFTFNSYELQAGTYKLVGCIGGSVDTFYIDCRTDSGLQLIDEGNGVVFSTSGQSGYDCRLIVNEGVELSNVIVKPMITNNTSLSYDDFIMSE